MRIPLVLLCLAPFAALADSTLVVTTQGRILDENDAPVSGAHSLRFAIYSVSDNLPGQAPVAPTWEDTFQVTLSDGHYAVVLGEPPGEPLSTDTFQGDRWLGITLDNGTEFRPRIRFSSAPHAFEALHALAADTADHAETAGLADAAKDAEKLGGELPASYRDATKLVGLVPADSLGNAVVALSSSPPLAAERTGSSVTLALPKASATQDGFLSKEDWSNFAASGSASNNPAYIWNGTTAQTGSLNLSGAGTFGGALKAGSLEVGGAVNLKGNPVSGFRVENLGDAPGACDASRRGMIYFNTAVNAFYGCNGSKWRVLDNAPKGTATNPGTSCKDILDSGEASSSGLYWVRPGDPFQVWCDMETDGGGWTIVWASNASDAGSLPTAANEYGDNPTTGKYKISLARLQSIPQTEHILIRKPLSANRWLVVSAPFLSPSAAPVWPGHNHKVVTIRSRSGQTANVNLGTSNEKNSGGGWYGIAGTIDHHGDNYIELNSSCSGNYVYTYGGNSFAANTALGAGWPMTVGCSNNAADNPATMIGIR